MAKRPRGPLPSWKPTTPRTTGIVADLIARFAQHDREDTLPRGPRGIFYDLRPNGMGNGVTYRKYDSKHPKTSFGPMEAHQDIVQEVLLNARRAGMIPEAWVADERAPTPSVPIFDEGADDAAGSVARLVSGASVDLDPQQFQPIYVEVLCEAGDLVPPLERVIMGEYGVPVYSGAGFGGLKGKRAMGERALNGRSKPTVVLDIADCDGYGDDIYSAAAEDSLAWAGHYGEVHDRHLAATAEICGELRDELIDTDEPEIHFLRLALTPTQAEELGLLDADGKAEADAVPVPVMDRWLIEAVEALTLPACAGSSGRARSGRSAGGSRRRSTRRSPSWALGECGKVPTAVQERPAGQGDREGSRRHRAVAAQLDQAGGRRRRPCARGRQRGEGGAQAAAP